MPFLNFFLDTSHTHTHRYHFFNFCKKMLKNKDLSMPYGEVLGAIINRSRQTVDCSTLFCPNLGTKIDVRPSIVVPCLGTSMKVIPLIFK